MDCNCNHHHQPPMSSGQMTGDKMRHLVNVFFGKEDKRASFVVQQGEYNSREVVASLWERLPGGGSLPMNLARCHVMVVFQYGAVTTPEYTTYPVSDHDVGFIIPQCVLASPGMVQMQLRLYRDSSLLNSAVVPFKVLGSLSPSTLPKDEEVEPGLLGVLCQVREVLDEARVAENIRKEAEEERARTWAQWEKKINEFQASGQAVHAADNRYDFPSVGSELVIYLARDEKKIYQWNEALLRYEQLSECESFYEIKIINGGDASGIY